MLENGNISNNNVHHTIILKIPWTLYQPRVNLELLNLSKKNTPPAVFIQKLNEIKNDHSYCTPIYTDGSKRNDTAGFGTIIDNSSFKQRLPSNASIFTAEITASKQIKEKVGVIRENVNPLD